MFKHALLKDSPPTLSDKDDPQQRFFRGGVSSSMLAWSGMGSVCTQPAQFTQHIAISSVPIIQSAWVTGEIQSGAAVRRVQRATPINVNQHGRALEQYRYRRH